MGARFPLEDSPRRLAGSPTAEHLASTRDTLGLAPSTAFEVPDEVRRVWASRARESSASVNDQHAGTDSALELLAQVEIPNGPESTRQTSGRFVAALASWAPILGGSGGPAEATFTGVEGAGTFSASDRSGQETSRYGVREHAMAAIRPAGISMHGSLRGALGQQFLMFSPPTKPTPSAWPPSKAAPRSSCSLTTRCFLARMAPLASRSKCCPSTRDRPESSCLAACRRHRTARRLDRRDHPHVGPDRDHPESSGGTPTPSRGNDRGNGRRPPGPPAGGRRLCRRLQARRSTSASRQPGCSRVSESPLCRCLGWIRRLRGHLGRVAPGDDAPPRAAVEDGSPPWWWETATPRPGHWRDELWHVGRRHQHRGPLRAGREVDRAWAGRGCRRASLEQYSGLGLWQAEARARAIGCKGEFLRHRL